MTTSTSEGTEAEFRFSMIDLIESPVPFLSFC